MMNDNSQFPKIPPISNAMLNALDARFPERSPSLGDDYSKLMFDAGARSVIRFLKAEYEEQAARNLSMGEV